MVKLKMEVIGAKRLSISYQLMRILLQIQMKNLIIKLQNMQITKVTIKITTEAEAIRIEKADEKHRRVLIF